MKSFLLFLLLSCTLPADAQEPPNSEIYTISDRMASFPGGLNGWDRYIQKHLNANIPVQHQAGPGRYTVIVSFIIDEKGNVSELKPITSHGFGMEAELSRLISAGPKWIPALQKGKAVKSIRKQPVTFVVKKGN